MFLLSEGKEIKKDKKTNINWMFFIICIYKNSGVKLYLILQFIYHILQSYNMQFHTFASIETIAIKITF